MADYNDIKERIQQVIRPNGTGAITAADHQKLLLEMVDKIDNDFDSVEQNIKNAVSQDGKYPELTAGFANNLVGRGEAVDATINFRPSGGTSIEDGAARVKELKGNSVVWNQKADARNVTGSNTTITNISEHGFDMSAPQQSTDMLALLGPLFVNRKYYVGFSYTSTLPYTLQYMGGQRGLEASSDLRHVGIIGGQLAAEYTSIYWYIFGGTNAEWKLQVRDLVVYDLTQMFGVGNEPTTIEEFYNRIPQNVDLYAYNEGEVIHTNAEGIKSVGFNAWDEEWENGYYAVADGNAVTDANYVRSKNAIRILGATRYAFTLANTHGIQSDIATVLFYDENNAYISFHSFYANGGFSQEFTTPQNAQYMRFYLTDYYGKTYENDICINLAHSGYRNGEYQPYVQFIRDIDSRIREAFPNGLRSAGTASDKVHNKNGKGYIEKHIGVLDLGTIDWVHQTIEGTYVFRSNGQSKSYGIKDSLNGLCSRYLHTSQTASIINSDGYIDVYSTWLFDEGNIIINDSRYSSPYEFKNSLNGVYLFYELAEPEILEFDEPFNLDYEVWDFGTEQMIATEPSAPIKASIVYGFNAVDSVRTAQLEIAALKTQIAQMQAIMASMTAQSAALTE